jgi:hypothetical protein
LQFGATPKAKFEMIPVIFFAAFAADDHVRCSWLCVRQFNGRRTPVHYPRLIVVVNHFCGSARFAPPAVPRWRARAAANSRLSGRTQRSVQTPHAPDRDRLRNRHPLANAKCGRLARATKFWHRAHRSVDFGVTFVVSRIRIHDFEFRNPSS